MQRSPDDAFWIEDLRGWRHTLDGGAPTAGWSWCGGRAGTVSAQLTMGALGRSALSLDRVRSALGAEPTGSLVRPTLGLCCGTAGILDALIAARGALRDGAPRDAELTRGIGARIGEAEGLLTGSAALRKVNPVFTTLFSGCAGAAMALARSLWPDRIRSVVWFE